MDFIQKCLFIFLIYDLRVFARNDPDWWKYTTIYEVYIWSFKDSDGDGIGDIKGVTSMLDHFVDLGIETIWLSPCFKSPMRDMGYDVANFVEIEPMFGTMADFEELIREMKKRGLKILLDFVINHTSDQHHWFSKSIDKIEPFTNYYTWKDAKGYDTKGNPIPPNNWLSLFGGSQWTWNEKRKQFYHHQFAVRQPDLNLRNEDLKKELKKIVKFWFDKGVSGARLDAARHYMEDLSFHDESPLRPDLDTSKPPYYYDYDHRYTTDLWDTYEYIHDLREFVDLKCSSKNDVKILIVESYTDLNHTMLYYGKKNFDVVHFPFNFDLVELESMPDPISFDTRIKKWLDNMPAGGVANWVAENHDNLRVGNRLNEEYIDLVLVSIMTLPGVACIYYGQEIGMMDNNIRPDQIRDPNMGGVNKGRTRDTERLPMQWDDSMNAGFSSKVKPWLPVSPNYWRVNVLSQKNQKNSRYNLYKSLSKLRQTKTLRAGSFRSYIVSPWVYAFSRSVKGEPTYISIFNMGTETEIVYLHHSIPNLPPIVKVAAASINAGYGPGDKIRTNPKFPTTFIMRPLSTLVVTTK